MRIPKHVVFVFFLLLLSSFLPIRGYAQSISCYAPGNLVVNDPDDLGLSQFFDIQKIYVAEPYFNDGSQKLVISLQVRSLRPLIPLAPITQGTWNVLVTSSTGTQRFVRMDTTLGASRFDFGTITSLLGIQTYNHQGMTNGTYSNDGLVSFYIDKSSLGNPAVGSTVSISAKTFLLNVGLQLLPIDTTASINYMIQGNSTCAPYQYSQFGLNGDVPVAKDYTRNGTADFAVWRPDTGMWYSLDSVTSALKVMQYGDGNQGDVPVIGNYDDDQKADPAVYRRSTGDWYIYSTQTGSDKVMRFGIAEDIPIAADFDGDHVDDNVIWRPSTRTWYIMNSSDGSVRIELFGLSEDRPVVGDYDGDRRADIAVFRPSNGLWYIKLSTTGAVQVMQWGIGTDVTVQSDYDGDGKTDIAVWRPETGVWYIFQSATSTNAYGNWGVSTDIVQPGDYNGNGRTDLAVWRPETGVWYVNYR